MTDIQERAIRDERWDETNQKTYGDLGHPKFHFGFFGLREPKLSHKVWNRKDPRRYFNPAYDHRTGWLWVPTTPSWIKRI